MTSCRDVILLGAKGAAISSAGIVRTGPGGACGGGGVGFLEGHACICLDCDRAAMLMQEE